MMTLEWLKLYCVDDTLCLTWSGEVSVWDIGRDGDLVIASSGIGDDSHREPVSRLQWVAGHDGKNKKHNVS